MMEILDENLPVTPENLYRLVDAFIAEYRGRLFLRGQPEEPRIFRNGTEICLGSVSIGWVTAFPLTPLSSIVSIEANSNYSTCEMEQLRGYIIQAVKGDSQEAEKKVTTLRESNHFAYPPDKRREIVNKYRQEKASGHVISQNKWANHNYGISGRTLRNYELEIEEAET